MLPSRLDHSEQCRLLWSSAKQVIMKLGPCYPFLFRFTIMNSFQNIPVHGHVYLFHVLGSIIHNAQLPGLVIAFYKHCFWFIDGCLLAPSTNVKNHTGWICQVNTIVIVDQLGYKLALNIPAPSLSLWRRLLGFAVNSNRSSWFSPVLVFQSFFYLN